MYEKLVSFGIAIFLFMLCSPIILMLIFVVRLDSKGETLIKLKRVGKDGKPFYLYKIRTMYSGTEEVTRVGRFLRKFGLDEIPQLINVIKGEMSLVGPRPELPEVVKSYNEYEKQRLKVLPGITGLWQISPYRNEPIHSHLEYDLHYIEQRSLFLDFKIFFSTFGWLFLKLWKKNN